MRNTILFKRLQLAERAAKKQSKFAAGCICFPETGPGPHFMFPVEQHIAWAIKCPFHGHRFKFMPLFYAAKWLRAKQESFVSGPHVNDQYRKAWITSFPRDLWPATEEQRGGKTFLRLKDGTKLLAYELSTHTTVIEQESA